MPTRRRIPHAPEPDLRSLFDAIAAGDTAKVLAMLKTTPTLAVARAERGATRADAAAHLLAVIQYYIYAGDTALHIAAAAHQPEVVAELLKLGADVHARNRRQATPLHHAANGHPGSTTWDPAAQARTVTLLLQAGADPNATDMGMVTPLHRAVRNRCAAAVRALLAGGADAQRRTGGGSTPLQLARLTTGRGGTGAAAAKAQQAEILRLLDAHGAGTR